MGAFDLFGSDSRRDNVQRRVTELKAKGNVDKHNVNFSGRTAEMRLLRESLALPRLGVLTAVHGLGGIGKTALACAYAQVYADEYPGGCWQVKCEGCDDLRTALISLVGARDFEFEFSGEEKRDLELGFERVLRELEKRADAAEPKRVLLILDNVDRAELLAPAQTRRLPAADWLHLIATTRLGAAELGQGPDRCRVAINELPEQEAVDLIEKWQPNGSFPNEVERRAAHALARLLGGYPLAVESAAVYLGQSGGEVTCAGFAERLEKEGLAGLETAVGDPAIRLRHDEKRLSVTLQATLDRLSAPERSVLTCASLLPADYVVPPWIRPLTAAEFPELGRDAGPGYPDPWRTVLDRLISLRFLQLTAEFNIVRIHRLVQDLIRQRTEPARLDSLEAALVSEVDRRGSAFFEQWIRPETRWEMKALAACAGRWMGTKRWMGVGARIANDVAGPLSKLARLAEAEPLLRSAVLAGERNFGPEDPELARSLNNLAALAADTNRLAEAEALYRRTLLLQEKRLGHEAPRVATVLANLANVLEETGRLAEAEALYSRALAIQEKSLGPDHPAVASCLHNLAILLKRMRRVAEAEGMFRRALAIQERSLAPDHPDTASTLNGLAVLLKETDRLGEADVLCRQALEILERTFGPDHPLVAQSLHNLALLLEGDRPAEAAALYRRALDVSDRTLGPDHPLGAQCLNNLAHLLVAHHRLAEAEPIYRRALATQERKFGPDDPHVALALINLMVLLRKIGRPAEAEPLSLRALAIRQKNLKPGESKVAT